MAFFGLSSTLEDEREKFYSGGALEEDVAVYTWGEDGYDGLGDALQEGGDELNDETFGGTGAVGKDFDFAQPAFAHSDGRQNAHASQRAEVSPKARAQEPARNPLQSIWDDTSPNSVLPRLTSASRVTATDAKQESFASPTQHAPPAGSHRTSKRSVQAAPQDIDAELLALAHQSRQQHAHSHSIEQPRLHGGQLTMEEVEQQLRSQQLAQQQQGAQKRQEQEQMLQLQQRQQLEHQQMEHQQQLQQQMVQQQLAQLAQQQQLQQLQQLHLLQQQQAAAVALSSFDPRHARSLSAGQQQLLLQAQMQQQMLAEQVHALQMQNLQAAHAAAGLPPPELTIDPVSALETEARNVVMNEAMRKIMEAERMEEKRRRRLQKISLMSHYNDLMTQSDKDFITRIQVSQLVTQDPYAEDFYAQVFGAILRARMGIGSGTASDQAVLKFGGAGGIGLGLPGTRAGRRENAMQRMAAQVERIVHNAQHREKEKGLHSLHSLQGALGKTAGRSYKAAPRPLLQVDGASGNAAQPNTHAHISKEDSTNHTEGASREAAKIGRAALGVHEQQANGTVPRDPLTRHEALYLVEELYNTVLSLEQRRRDASDAEPSVELEQAQRSLIEQIWTGLQVAVPLETCEPHPLISLLAPAKGKRLIPRLTRHLNASQLLTLFTLIIACFAQLDVVRDAALLDSLEDTREKKDMERQTQVFLASVLQSLITVVAHSDLRMAGGLLALMLDRAGGSLVKIAQSRPGLTVLTVFLSRAEVLKQGGSQEETPSLEDIQQWQNVFDHLFQLLVDHLLTLFPSTRLSAATGQAPGQYAQPSQGTDILDQPVWQFLAALALHASPEQQSLLVTRLREKVLENVMSANKGWVADESERRAKIGNVNLFLHALGLDSSQITL